MSANDDSFPLRQLRRRLKAASRKIAVVDIDHEKSGELDGIRTHDPMIKSHVLYRLSYELSPDGVSRRAVPPGQALLSRLLPRWLRQVASLPHINEVGRGRGGIEGVETSVVFPSG